MGGDGGNDLWGCADGQTGREYALMGLTNGTAFVDVTDPRDPVFLGRLPAHELDSVWRDIKVHSDHAYIVADGVKTHGIQVFDLTRLRGLSAPQTFAADVRYIDFQSAHNLAIDKETGFAYAVMTDTCAGGVHIVDIRTPINPTFAGCHDATRTHNAQCVIYRGPDDDHRDREICIGSNEDHVEVVDVTDKSAPLGLSTAPYPQLAYVHQGWLTDDHRFFLLGDTVFEANYTSGLRVLRFCDLAAREIEEVAFFDTFPEGDEPGAEGAWGVYPYLPSGTILVSDIANRLFVLTID